MLHDLACNQFRFSSPIFLQIDVFLYTSADDISYTSTTVRKIRTYNYLTQFRTENTIAFLKCIIFSKFFI